MKTTSKMIVAMAAVCLAGVLGMAGCSQTDGGSNQTDKGPVAATMGDVTVYENDVTAQVEAVRVQNGYTDDTMWAWVLSLSGYTPESFREYMIKSIVYNDVVPVAAEQKGVSVSAEDVDAALEHVRADFNLTDEQWETTLANSGFTPESYRKAIEFSLLEQALYDNVTAGAEVTDEIFEEYGMQYVESYYSNIKRSSHILFAPEDEATAADVLAQLQAGTLEFADAVAQYSIDTGSAVAGGDVGWSGIHSFVDEYQTALDGLAVGEMSGLVLSQFGYHIILCTDAFTWTESTTASDLPAELYEHITTNYLAGNVANIVYNDFIDGVRDGMGFTINPMPAGLSYDVDIDALLNPTEDEGEGREVEGAAAGEGTDGEDVSLSGEGTTAGE